MRPACPNIYDFKDPVDFLKAHIAWRKRTSPDFSVRKWSVELGLRSDLIFSLLRDQKKLSLNLVPIFAQNIQLESAERTYLEVMSKYATAVSLKEKEIFKTVLAEISGLKGTRAVVLDDSLYYDWLNLAILVMAELPDCHEDDIPHLLLNETPGHRIQEAIRKLVSMGLMVRDERGCLSRVHDHATTKDEVPMPGVHRYYEQVFDLAKMSISTPLEQREFQSFTLAINNEELPMFKEAIRHFRAKMSSIPTQRPNQLYHCNVQFFPMTKEFIPGVRTGVADSDGERDNTFLGLAPAEEFFSRGL